MQFEWCKWISLSLSSSSLSLYPPKYSSQMEDTFLEARPLWYLTVSLIKVEMDNADKTASSCLCLASASEDQGIPRGEGSVCCWLLRIPLKSGWEWGPTFTSPNPETNTTFQEDNARAETSPPFPLHPKESCKHFYHVFKNSALNELSQIFNSFSLSQARDIHARDVGGTCAHTFNIPFQSFLNGAPASPGTLNTQILLKTHGSTGCGRDWHKFGICNSPLKM